MPKKTAAKKTAPKADLDQGEGGVEVAKKNASTGAEQPVKSEKYNVPEEPGVYTQPVAHVGFKLGYTKNLGNYESVRFEVWCSLPCYVNEVDSVFDFAKDWVDGKLEHVVSEFNDSLDSDE